MCIRDSGTNEEGARDKAENADIAEADKADDEDDHGDHDEDADKADEDDSHFALPDDLLSDDGEEAPAEASIAGSANVSNAEEDATHQGDGSTSGDEEEESEAAGDETDQGKLLPELCLELYFCSGDTPVHKLLHMLRAVVQTPSDVCWLSSLHSTAVTVVLHLLVLVC